MLVVAARNAFKNHPSDEISSGFEVLNRKSLDSVWRANWLSQATKLS
jgi:hypothetical protein